jgi:hypothetical protein
MNNFFKLKLLLLILEGEFGTFLGTSDFILFCLSRTLSTVSGNSINAHGWYCDQTNETEVSN